MNRFKLFIKSGKEYVKFPCTPVFPFSWGELLDERLDEAYVTIYDCRQENIPRLTEVKVTIINGEKTRDEYFIVASDNSYELPLGSKKYKHELYLIERTKLLEGIYCSSLTFTNSKGNVYTNNHSNPLAKDDNLGGSYSDLYNKEAGGVAGGVFSAPLSFPTIQSPVPSDVPYSPPSAYEIAIYVARYLDESYPYTYFDISPQPAYTYQNDQFIETQLTVDNNIYKWEERPTTFYLNGKTQLNYSIILKCSADGSTSYLALGFSLSVEGIPNRLPLKRWSITDCVTRACELAEPLFGTDTPKYRLDGVEYDENGNVKKPYPAGSLAEKYDKVFAPEITLTQDTLREQLKVIFSYVHAEPWLDENDVIQATEYGSTVKSAAGTIPYVYNAVSSHINEYCTEVRSHAQNLASSLGYAKGVMVDPGKGLYRSLRTDIAYSRITESNGIARTEKPIYEITQVMCGVAKSDGTWNLSPVDITPYVFEATEYGANLSSYAGGYPYSKQYAIYYTQGSPNLGGLFYKAPDNVSAAKFSPFAISNILSAVSGKNVNEIDGWLVKEGAAQLVFSITYKPISNHFVSHGKSLYVAGEKPYMQLYNQSENLVESQFYGENLKGVAARLGNVEKERTFILKSLDHVPKVGQLLDGYAISAVSCELYPFDIKCTVGLSKDFNRISQYVGIDSHKRMYEISERQATQRDILIKETLVIGTKPDGHNTSGLIFKDLTPFYNVFDCDADMGGYQLSVAAFYGRGKKKTSYTNSVMLPIISRALGNAITFNFAMKDNYSAGNGTQYISGSIDGITGRWETDAPYTDYYGRIWWGYVNLYGGNTSVDFPDIIEQAYNLPNLPNSFDTGTGPSFNTLPDTNTKIISHRLRKDSREVLSYNIELEIKTDNPDIIVGSALASCCGWVNDTAVGAVMYFFDNTKYSIGKFDKQYTPHEDDAYGGYFGSSLPVGAWSAELDNSGLSLKISGQGSGKGWVICTPIEKKEEEVEDEDGNVETITYQTGGEILLASNVGVKAGEEFTLDFYVTKN